MRTVEHTVYFGDRQAHLVGPAGDHQTRAWQQGSFYEPGLLSWLSERALPPGVVLDVGACFGNHTVFFAVVMRRRVLAVEPWPVNLECLRRSVRRNPGADVTIITAACSHAPGWVQMTSDYEGNEGMAHVAPQGMFVPAVTIDAIAEEHDARIALIKIDVEGHAEAVLEGAQQTLARWRPLVTCECIGQEKDAVDAVMQRAGYRRRGETFNATPTFIYEHGD